MQTEELSQSQGILLDLGCGGSKQKGFVGIDSRDVEGVDIVHDLEIFPWPLHDDSCFTIIGSHLIEHIKPWLTIAFMDEIWRILIHDRDVALSTPYGGSQGFWQDPTHCNGWIHSTWQYFDPRYPLYQIYKPKPFIIKKGFPVWQQNGNMECVLTKINLDEVNYWVEKGFSIDIGPEAEVEPIPDELQREDMPESLKAEPGPTLGISVHEEVTVSDKPGGGD